MLEPVLPVLRRRLPLPAPAVRSKLALADAFAMETRGDDLVVWRKRLVPRRGLFRLLIPRVRATFSPSGEAVRCTIRLDGLALFMVVMLAGGVVVERTMPRDRYPREYPPAFVYALAAVYAVLIVYDVWMTDRSLRRALG